MQVGENALASRGRGGHRRTWLDKGRRRSASMTSRSRSPSRRGSTPPSPTLRSRSPMASSSRSSAPRMRQVDLAECRRGSDRSRRGARVDLRKPAHRDQSQRRLSLPGRCAVSLEDGDRQRRHRPRDGRNGEGGGAPAGADLARAHGPVGVRQSLSAHAVGRPAQARRTCAGAHPRSAHPLDGRAVRSARCADAGNQGRAPARSVERRSQGGALRHPTISRKPSRFRIAS